MKAKTHRDLVTMAEVGERLGVSIRSAYRAVAQGDVPTFRIGRRWFVPREAFEALLRGDRVMPGRGRPAVEAAGATDVAGNQRTQP